MDEISLIFPNERRSRVNPIVKRRKTRMVRVGNLRIGGNAPVSVQSMLKTPPGDLKASLQQARDLESLGCELLRVAVPDRRAALRLKVLKKEISIPLAADIHFSSQLARLALRQGVDKIRINPGNMEKEGLGSVVKEARDTGKAIRIGLNSGSAFSRKGERLRRGEDLPRFMVRKAMEYLDFFESLRFYDSIVSLKSSNVLETIQAYRIISKKTDAPLHLGVTAAGTVREAAVKSAVALGSLLLEGIGDTLRVSITGPPDEEVRTGWEILKALGLRRKGLNIFSCPTCGRCAVDIPSLVEKLRERTRGLEDRLPLDVAVMGCVVNGPGEAREADLGIAGGRGFGILFKRGKKIRKISEEKLANELIEEILSFAGRSSEGKRSSGPKKKRAISTVEREDGI